LRTGKEEALHSSLGPRTDVEDPEGEHTELDAKVGDTLENQS